MLFSFTLQRAACCFPAPDTSIQGVSSVFLFVTVKDRVHRSFDKAEKFHHRRVAFFDEENASGYFEPPLFQPYFLFILLLVVIAQPLLLPIPFVQSIFQREGSDKFSCAFDTRHQRKGASLWDITYTLLHYAQLYGVVCHQDLTYDNTVLL